MSRRRSKLNTKAHFPRGKKLLDARMIEQLETRILFNTIITDTDPLTATPATVTFEFKGGTATGASFRVVVHGDVSAEFVFARVDEDTNKVVLGDFVAAGSKEDGRDLFHIYIAQASIDSYISIAQVADPTTPGPRPMEPFGGGVPLVITPNIGNATGITTDFGSVFIGARTFDLKATADTNEANHPILSAHYNGQGIFPANSKNRLVAGITTAPGVSIGKILIGGTVTGEVNLGGSIESFYCGNLLTGNANGQSEVDSIDSGNFFVQGDMRNLLVMGSIGTDGLANTAPDRAAPHYLSGTDIVVHGRVGQIRAGDDDVATATVYNDNIGLGLRTRQQEIEVLDPDGVNRGQFTEFENGQFGDGQAFFNNNTFDSAQMLGSINSKDTGNNSVQVNGLYQWVPKVDDQADFYSVAMMAGQSIGVRLIAPIVANSLIVNGQTLSSQETKSELHVGVFDPDDRLIASDYSNATDTTSQSLDIDPAQQEYFSFTASKPGIYRFAVGKDATFAAPGLKLGEEQPYQLQVTGVGELGLGGLVAQNTIYAPTAFSLVGTNGQEAFDDDLANAKVIHGDLGAVYSIADDIVSGGGFAGVAVGGDFRAIDAVSLGQINNGAFGDGPEIEAVTGSIGMIRTSGTGADDCTLFNDDGNDVDLLARPIGGDIQYIVAPNKLGTGLAVDGSVGVVQVNQWGFDNYAGGLSVNFDGKGKPGVIDLIDVTGNLGTLAAGGPVISTNTGGDVRYIHLSDSSTAFRPRLFGGSQPEQTTYVQGQEADITDDSGAQIVIQPTLQRVLDPVTGLPEIDPTTLKPVTNDGTLTVLTYPIARTPTSSGGIGTSGGGGVVIIRIDSTRGAKITTTGGSAEIGTINCGTADAGPGLVFDDNVASTLGGGNGSDTFNGDAGPDGIVGTGDDPFELDPNSTNTMGLVLQGTLTDVFMVKGTNFAEIENKTGGEIVNTNVGTVGTLSANTLGVAKSSIRAGMATEGVAVADNPGTSEVEGDTFPFLHAKNAIVINGGGEANPAVINIASSQSIGNVMIFGRAQSIAANADNVGTKGVFEGIVGAVYAKGQIRDVQIGEGLMPSGTGNMGIAGIYCVSATPSQTTGLGRIENVTNQGLDSDIRGDIVSDSGIGTIALHNGSIINSDIMVVENQTPTATGDDLKASEEFVKTAVITHNNQGTIGNIDAISISGVGGIIGLFTESANVGQVSSTGGFGIINSTFVALGDGRFGAVTADGYGARGDTWQGGQSLDGITVLGNGHRLTTTSFEPAVLLSSSQKVDPFLGTKPNALTDLYVVTGTTPAAPQRKGVSASGSIDLSTIQVSRDVGFINANTIRADTFNIANNLGSIYTDDYVDSMILTCGRITSMTIGKDALRDSINVSGPVGAVYIGGTFRGSSNLTAGGENGSIASFTTRNSLFGNVYGQAGIGTISVGTTFGSQGTSTPKNITTFSVKGDVATGAVLTVGAKDTDAFGRITTLAIGGDLQDGALIRLHSFGTKTIKGQEIGTIDLWPWS